jgi:hypothetical protein
MATTTPNYGWDVPTSTDYVKDGATAIETLGDDIDATLYTALGGAYPGLRLIKKQTIGAGVASVTVTGAFSATYDNYKVIVNDFDASADDALFGVSVNGTTGNNYSSAYNAINIGTAAASTGASAAAGNARLALTSTANASCSFDVINPFATAKTYFLNGSGTGFNFTMTGSSGYTLTNNSSTAFTLAPTGGTITGGTIYVYGYGIS